VRILLTSQNDQPRLMGDLRKQGFAPEFVPVDRLVEFIGGAGGTISADAIVCLATFAGEAESELRLSGSLAYPTAIKLARDIRRLPDACAMRDGRKWKVLPCIFLTYELVGSLPTDDPVAGKEAVTLIPYDDENEISKNSAFSALKKSISDYLQRLLREMEDLGFLVAYDNGRFRIGPALNPKRGIEGYYYYGPGDRRKTSNKLFTVDRDLFGIKYEIELFEALINNPNVNESNLQKFFEEHPHFLVGSSLAEPISHPHFSDGKGNLLVPDFVMKPVVAQERHSKWEVLDLKLPAERLISGPARHRGFSSAVTKAITQLKNYGDYFQNPGNSEIVKTVLGHALRYPRLAVVIGRLPEEGQLEELERAQSREPYVRIVTYDEILETQTKLMSH
jgi:Domain of unknown function (DUF4263)